MFWQVSTRHLGIDILHEASSAGAAFDSPKNTIFADSQILGNNTSPTSQTGSLNLSTHSVTYELTTAFPDYHDTIEERISSDRVGKKKISWFKSLIPEPLQWDHSTLCDGKIHTILLGYFQSCWTLHCNHTQSGRRRFRHSFCRTPYLAWGRRQNWDVSPGRAQEISWTPRLSPTAIVMAILQNYQDACEYSRLQSVLGALSRPRKQPFTSPFLQLDILNVHIMIQIPESILMYTHSFWVFRSLNKLASFTYHLSWSSRNDPSSVWNPPPMPCDYW